MGSGPGSTIPSTPSDSLLPDEILHRLRSARFGKSGLHHYREIGSTNDRARQLALHGCPEGTVVVADSQSAGRGRLGRTWESPPGTGLYFSLILRPDFPAKDGPRVTLLAGVAVCRAVNALVGLEARIKWPNDILVHGRKVAGILAEMEVNQDRIHHVVVGVGVNVNTHPSSFPAVLRERSSSLAVEARRTVSKTALLCSILIEMEDLWDVLLSSGFEPIREAWRELNATLGHRVRAEGVGAGLVGKAVDLDPDGSLLVRSDDGTLHKVPFGEVSLLAPRTPDTTS